MKYNYLKDELMALKLAVGNEKKIREFYLKHSERIKSPLAKKTFIFLANEELKHIETINDFSKSINDGEEPEIEPGPEDKSINRAKEFFSKSIEEKAEKLKPSDGELKIYELGMEMEQKGYKFYNEAAEKAGHQNVRKLFEFLTKEENGHYALLSNSINYLKNPGSFFQDQESWFFEG